MAKKKNADGENNVENKNVVEVKNAETLLDEYNKQTEKLAAREKRHTVEIIVFLAILLVCVIVYSVLPHWHRIYKDIGAKPHGRPDVVKDAEETDVYSKDDIEAAENAVCEFAKDWEKPDGGMYLLEVDYEDAVAQYALDANVKTADELICLTGDIYTGKSGEDYELPKYFRQRVWFYVEKSDGSAKWDKVTMMTDPLELLKDEGDDSSKSSDESAEAVEEETEEAAEE